MTQVKSTSVSASKFVVGAGIAEILSSTYFLVAACRSAVGAPDNVNAPVIVPPAMFTLPARVLVIVVAKLASLPKAVANSFNVFNALVAPLTKLSTCP